MKQLLSKYNKMSIQILSNNNTLTQQLLNILTHYFPSQNNKSPQNIITISTKYYTCEIPIKVCSMHKHTNNTEQEVQEKEEVDKIDGIIFVVGQQQTIEGFGSCVQGWVKEKEPEFVVVLVDGRGEGEWKYQEQLVGLECFVPVVYENLENVCQVMPKWVPNRGLLKQQEQQQRQIFTLLEMLQTASWSNQIQIQTPKPTNTPHTLANPESTPTQPQNPNTNTNPNPNPNTNPKDSSSENQNQQGQPTQQQLQKQMYQFQILMQQMMQVKTMSTNVGHNEKKKRAEDVIMKLAKFMGEG